MESTRSSEPDKALSLYKNRVVCGQRKEETERTYVILGHHRRSHVAAQKAIMEYPEKGNRKNLGSLIYGTTGLDNSEVALITV